MKICTLASGSSGNASVIFNNETKILVDAGISSKRIDETLSEIGLTGDEIDAVFITHEHIDHCRGINMFCKKHNIPVYANKETMAELIEYGYVKKLKDDLLNTFQTGDVLTVGSFSITSFHTSHDCVNPVGYRITSGDVSAAVTTDLGIVTDEIMESLKGVKALILESNHDTEVLKFCSYPFQLKQRIASEIGHLSNVDSANLSVYLARCGLSMVMLGHLSEESNTPELARSTYNDIFSKNNIDSCKIFVAPRNGLSEIMTC